MLMSSEMKANKNTGQFGPRRLIFVLIIALMLAGLGLLAYRNSHSNTAENDTNVLDDPEFCKSIPRYSDKRCHWDP